MTHDAATFTVRPERHGDEAGVRAVVRAAFPTPAEADLVDALRDAGRLALSLVACAGDAGREEIVGHVAFSPLDRAGGLGLAPLAVAPARQRRGAGGALVRAGLDAARARGAGFVVVLGEPAYYGRFGFRAASAHGLRDAYGGGEAFQVLALREGALPEGAGLLRYAPEFAVFEDGA